MQRELRESCIPTFLHSERSGVESKRGTNIRGLIPLNLMAHNAGIKGTNLKHTIMLGIYHGNWNGYFYIHPDVLVASDDDSFSTFC